MPEAVEPAQRANFARAPGNRRSMVNGRGSSWLSSTSSSCWAVISCCAPCAAPWRPTTAKFCTGCTPGPFVTMLAIVPAVRFPGLPLPARPVHSRHLCVFHHATCCCSRSDSRAMRHPLWMQRAFYIWLSVFNLFVVSIFWSFMADIFRPGQAQTAVRLHHGRRQHRRDHRALLYQGDRRRDTERTASCSVSAGFLSACDLAGDRAWADTCAAGARPPQRGHRRQHLGRGGAGIPLRVPAVRLPADAAAQLASHVSVQRPGRAGQRAHRGVRGTHDLFQPRRPGCADPRVRFAVFHHLAAGRVISACRARW